MRLFRREWVFPALMVAFITTSAEASSDTLSAQAAGDLACSSVTLDQVSPEHFVATGCGRERTYDCTGEGDCVSDGASSRGVARGDSDEDNAVADAVAGAMMDLACACASGAVGSQGARSSHNSTHKSNKR